MLLTEAEARSLSARAFERAGVPPSQAEDAARILNTTEMMGIPTHGLARVAIYIERIKTGGTDARAIPTVEAPAAALRLVDGQNALGPAVAQSGLAAAIEAAETCGIGAAFCRRSGHIGALAPYLWQATEQGYACIMTTNTAPMIAPAGGREPLLGNNPIGIGMPFPGADPVLLDMALSVAARSRIRDAAERGLAIPDTWALDKSGQPTTNPREALHGLLQAIGGSKGANLALGLDLMAGVLSGAAMLAEVPNANEDPSAVLNLGHMIVVIDTAKLLPTEDLARRMTQMAEAVTGVLPADPDQPVRLPGSRAIAAYRDASRDGMDLPAELVKNLLSLAS